MFVSRYARVTSARTVTAATEATAATVATLALAATLSGCQSGSTSAAADARQQHSASPAAAATSKPAATPTVVASPTRPCATSDLSIAPAQRHVTEGVQVERFTLTTATPTGCTLSGPMHLVPKGPLSTQVPGATVDLALSQQDFPGDLDITPPQTTTIPLTPAKPASFYLAWFSASPVVCVQSNGLRFNAPDDTAFTDMRSMSYAIGPICDGVFYASAVF